MKFNDLVNEIAKTQDGGELNENDEFSAAMLILINKNIVLFGDGDMDMENLEEDFSYFINQLTKALNKIKELNNEPTTNS